MRVTKSALPGVLIIEPEVHGDERGFFMETFHVERYRELVGIDVTFVQDNHSRSRYGVLRGMHAQRLHPQGKLVRVARGEVFDVALDIDPQSPTFGQWEGTRLSDVNGRQMWIPPGYAHGFVVLSEVADFEYKCSDYYHPDDEYGVIWNDPDAGIQWPLADPVLSDKDKLLPPLASLRSSI